MSVLSSVTVIERLAADHVWQSTLVAVIAAAVTWTLRRHRAQVRHAIWLAASAKFLLPFVALVALGGQVSWRSPSPSVSTEMSAWIDTVGQPFTPAIANPSPAVAPTAHTLVTALPLLLAGALRSTANDLLTFLSAVLGTKPSTLSSAMAVMLTARRSTGAPGLDVALGWHILTRTGTELIWHNGGTGGYRSFVGYDPRAGVGVVVLSNTSTATGVDDIGMHLLDGRSPLLAPPKAHIEVAVDAGLVDGYVGRYQLAPNFVLAITREGDRLFVQATNQPRFEIFAEGEKEYFLKVVEAQITFVVDGQGRTTAIILHQNGADRTANRIE